MDVLFAFALAAWFVLHWCIGRELNELNRRTRALAELYAELRRELERRP